MANVFNLGVASVSDAGVATFSGPVLAGTINSYTTATPAIALTDSLAILDATSNGVAATLAAGSAGQVIRVKATVVSGGATTLTPAAFADGTTVTFTPANEYIVLMSDGTNWYCVGGTAAIT